MINIKNNKTQHSLNNHQLIILSKKTPISISIDEDFMRDSKFIETFHLFKKKNVEKLSIYFDTDCLDKLIMVLSIDTIKDLHLKSSDISLLQAEEIEEFKMAMRNLINLENLTIEYEVWKYNLEIFPEFTNLKKLTLKKIFIDSTFNHCFSKSKLKSLKLEECYFFEDFCCNIDTEELEKVKLIINLKLYMKQIHQIFKGNKRPMNVYLQQNPFEFKCFLLQKEFINFCKDSNLGSLYYKKNVMVLESNPYNFEEFSQISQLKTLDLENFYFQKFEELPLINDQMKSLSLNPFSVKDTEDIKNYLNYLKSFKNLTELTLNPLYPASIYIGEYLFSNPSLKHLVYINDKDYDKNLQILIAGLYQNTNLESLSIYHSFSLTLENSLMKLFLYNYTILDVFWNGNYIQKLEPFLERNNELKTISKFVLPYIKNERLVVFNFE